MKKNTIRIIINSAIVLGAFLLLIPVFVELMVSNISYDGHLLYLDPNKSITQLDEELLNSQSYIGYLEATGLVKCKANLDKGEINSYAYQKPTEFNDYELVEGIGLDEYQGDNLPVLIFVNRNNFKIGDIFQIELSPVDDNDTTPIIANAEVVGLLLPVSYIQEAEVDIGVGLYDIMFFMPREYEELLVETNTYILMENGLEQEYLDIINEYGYYTYNRLEGYTQFEAYNLGMLILVILVLLLSYLVNTISINNIKFLLINVALSAIAIIMYYILGSLLDIINYNHLVNICYLIIGLYLLLINIVSAIIILILNRKKRLITIKGANYEKY